MCVVEAREYCIERMWIWSLVAGVENAGVASQGVEASVQSFCSGKALF